MSALRSLPGRHKILVRPVSGWQRRGKRDRIVGLSSIALPRPMPRHLCTLSLAFAFSAVLPAQFIVLEGPEPNSFPNFTAMQCLQQGDGVIGSAADTDYWRLQFSGPQTLRVSVGPGFAQPRIQDTVLELRDAGNTLLASNDDGAGLGLYSEIRDFRIPGAGTYFVVVRGYTANVGSYSLDVQCGPAGPAWSPGVEIQEPNQTNVGASPSSCWTRAAGAIGFAGDIDRFAFFASAGQRISIATAPGANGVAISDTTLTLRNAAGLVLASNDDALGLYSRISFLFPTAGVYYVDVAGYLNQVIGTYQLEFDCSGIVPAPASVTIFGAGCLGSNGLVPSLLRRTSASGLTYIERPLIGTVMTGDLVQCPPLTVAFIGAALQDINPPIDLGFLGAPGCLAQILAEVFDAQPVSASGTANWVLPVPYDQGLVGVTVEYQALVFDPTVNSLGLTISNRLRAVVGNSF